MTKEQQAAMNDRSRRFQVLMTAREKQYPHESYHDRFMRCSASPEGAAIWAEAEQAKHTTPNSMMAANSYDASQPRDPAGTSTGGQWAAATEGQKLTKAESESMKLYQDGSHQEINRALREGWHDELEDYQKSTISDLDSAMEKNALPKAAVLFRSGIPRETLAGLKPGDTITDKAFQSASFSDAHENTTDLHFGKALAEIKAPAGTKGLFVSGGEKGYDTEKEFLLPRNTTLRFTGMNGKRFGFEVVKGDGK